MWICCSLCNDILDIETDNTTRFQLSISIRYIEDINIRLSAYPLDSLHWFFLRRSPTPHLGGADQGVITPKFELSRDFRTVHLPTKFHHPMFIRSEVMVLTNKQGSQEQEVKFQDQFIRKFQDIFVGFTRLKNQKMHVFLCSYILISAADQYCTHKNVTKAMLHNNIKQRNVTIKNITGHSTWAT